MAKKKRIWKHLNRITLKCRDLLSRAERAALYHFVAVQAAKIEELEKEFKQLKAEGIEITFKVGE